jgi:hypothetical protein
MAAIPSIRVVDGIVIDPKAKYQAGPRANVFASKLAAAGN